MSVFIQDARRVGHLNWVIDTLSRGCADGAVISPFCTPRIPQPRFQDAGAVAASLLPRYEVLFDPATHARLLPGVDVLAQYGTWDLWGSSGIGLNTQERRVEHVERVFARQREIGAPTLAPTHALTSPRSEEARNALEAARVARGFDSNCYQSLAGTRSFFSAGIDLDAYVGSLAALRAPVWYVTLMHDSVTDGAPDLDDRAAFVGWLRTVHSLSERSRVIVAHSDFVGLLAVAAGADSIGAGWSRGMRYFYPDSFQLPVEGAVRRSASYVTQQGLMAVLRRSTADDIERLDNDLAQMLRHGDMPADEQQERRHHLRMLHEIVGEISRQDSRIDRIRVLRDRYDVAIQNFNDLRRRLRGVVTEGDRDRWAAAPRAVLEAYAEDEGLWS